MRGSSNPVRPPEQARPATPVHFKRLRAELRGASADAKALASAAITNGGLVPTHLPPRIANRITGAHRDRAKAARDDFKLEKLIIDNGVERAWLIIDRLTKPAAVAAE